MIQDRIGVEIGGTFTDLVWRRNDGGLVTHKVMSTPAEIHQAVMRVIGEAGVDLAAVSHVVHGSTVATNALLTRRGACTGLLTTVGFRDVIEIGSHDRQGNVYEILYRKPRPPVSRHFIREVPERISADGAVVEAIDLEAGWREASELMDGGVDAIHVALSQAMPERVPAQGYNCTSAFYLSQQRRDGSYRVFVDILGGGYGACRNYGGGPGGTGSMTIYRQGEVISLSPHGSLDLETGDVLSLRLGGGGGFGDPARRSRISIERDIEDGRITTGHAETMYGYGKEKP